MVDVFFVLSGIVFSYTYQEPLQKSQVDQFDFFVKRFSRLYPVHFLTLIITTCIISLFYYNFKTYPIYSNNDLYHFFLNLLFLQRGYADFGYSFNGPSWSLSVEVLMYVLFFVQMRYFRHYILISIILACLGLLIFRFAPVYFPFLFNIDVSRGLMGFFSGSLLYNVFLKNYDVFKKKQIFLVLLFLSYFFYLVYLHNFIAVPLNIQVIVIMVICVPILHHNDWIRTHSNVRILVSLGDISLAVYMIHVPIQMIIIFYYRFTHDVIPFDSAIFLMTYSLSVILSGYLLHYYFEKPGQIWLRRAFVFNK